jgi:HSP20 family molecular chaperone IbpA
MLVPPRLARSLKKEREMTEAIPIEVHHASRFMDVMARLPGVRFEDVRIALTRDQLTIDAVAPEGRRHYAMCLASPVDDRRATMHFNDGVLRLHLPKLGP